MRPDQSLDTSAEAFAALLATFVVFKGVNELLFTENPRGSIAAGHPGWQLLETADHLAASIFEEGLADIPPPIRCFSEVGVSSLGCAMPFVLGTAQLSPVEEPDGDAFDQLSYTAKDAAREYAEDAWMPEMAYNDGSLEVGVGLDDYRWKFSIEVENNKIVTIEETLFAVSF